MSGRDSLTVYFAEDAATMVVKAIAAERERIRQYIAIRRGGLNQEDAYEAGKDMAYLSVLQYLAGADLSQEAQP